LNRASLGGNGGVEQRPDERNNVSPDPIEEGNAFRSFSNPVGRTPYQQDPRVEEATDDYSLSSHDEHESSLALTLENLQLSTHGPHSKSSSLNMSYSSDTSGNEQGYNVDPNLLQYMASLGAKAVLQQQKPPLPTHGFVRSTTHPSKLGVTGVAAPSGLEMRPTARTNTQLSSASVISCHDRGAT
jgi:hypothetical protein